MNKLRKNSISEKKNLEPKEGQREFLRSSKDSLRCPSFGIKNNSSENAPIDYLASILVEAFLDRKEYEQKQFCESKESSNLLSGINQRAG